MTKLFPFSAIVGQPTMRLALLLVAIQPRIGGVLIRGEKGTAKSTVVRALARALPTGRMRTLALSATEDRLVGGLDLEATLTTGSPVFQPGLLSDADGGIVYVDEVNLLDDHLANLVLDAAASGVVTTEREGFSVSMPSRFALVGTMNPEEGQLGAQLLDRFGLCVDVVAEHGLEERIEILRRRLAHDANPAEFIDSWAQQEASLAQRLAAARTAVGEVEVPAHIVSSIAGRCREAGTAGHRADLALTLAAQAHAAWQGRVVVTEEDVELVAELALVHRRRDQEPPDPPPPPSPTPPAEDPSREEPPETDNEQPDPPEEPEIGPDPSEELVSEIGASFKVRPLISTQDRVARSSSGRRRLTISADQRGHQIGSRLSAHPEDLALDATLRAAAVHQRRRRLGLAPGDGREHLAILVERGDWRRRVRMRRTGSVVVLVVDASASMGARNRMVASKGAVLSLLLDAYVKRDQVALVSFRRAGAEVLVPPTSSVEMAERRLREMPTGGRTPLASGLMAAHEVVRPLLLKDPAIRPMVVVVTDGRGNVGLDGTVSRNATDEAIRIATRLRAEQRISWVIVDTEPTGVMSRGRAGDLAKALGAERFTIENLRADDLVQIVNTSQNRQENR